MSTTEEKDREAHRAWRYKDGLSPTPTQTETWLAARRTLREEIMALVMQRDSTRPWRNDIRHILFGEQPEEPLPTHSGRAHGQQTWTFAHRWKCLDCDAVVQEGERHGCGIPLLTREEIEWRCKCGWVGPYVYRHSHECWGVKLTEQRVREIVEEVFEAKPFLSQVTMKLYPRPKDWKHEPTDEGDEVETEA